MTFDTLPPHLSALGNSLFPDSLPTVSLLPLAELEAKKHSLEQWLHKKELEQLADYNYPKRQQEWLAGRICAKQALRAFLCHSEKTVLILEHSRYRVAAEESGRPYFDQLPGISFPFPQLSITHSKSFAAALVSTTLCGIDIQYPAEGLQRVKERFCTEEEEQLLQESLPRLSQLSKLTLLWTGKEAIKKMLSPQGIPGFHELQLDKITATGKREMTLHFSRLDYKNDIPVAAAILNNGYGLALCCLI